jgi:hypothetical protein
MATFAIVLFIVALIAAIIIGCVYFFSGEAGDLIILSSPLVILLFALVAAIIYRLIT